MDEARRSFFECAEDRLIDGSSEFETVENLRKMFRRPSGIAVNTCHGVKGEEFEVVICFGLLKGCIPHWSRIYADRISARLEARRLLYVIASRAKMFLHLHSESGRVTTNRIPYETTEELVEFQWNYDDLFE